MKAEAFEIAIAEADLDDLRARLRGARWASDFANEDWRYGTPSDYLQELVEYWLSGYDWRAHEAAMNAYAHYRVSIDRIPIHFIHERGRGPRPMPLILTHGWPWTFWDFEQVIQPLTDPAAFGGDPADAFDVIVPSLPGFGFSSPLTQPGVDCAHTADLWDRLMRECLGYERYAAQGGDWGALVTSHLGHKYADHLYGIHESLVALPGLDYTALRPEDYGSGEEDWPARVAAKAPTIQSHMAVHSSDPQTLAWALNDSPLGLLAWIVERRRAWSDCGGLIERRFSKDQLLTTSSLYWLTGTIGTSLRFYYENAHRPFEPAHPRKPAIEAPSAFAIFLEDVVLIPRRIAEQHANVQRWTVMPRGGHFAPAEEPELIVEDVRAFFRDLR